LPTGKPFSKLIFADDQTIYAIGAARIARSRDGGKNWQAVEPKMKYSHCAAFSTAGTSRGMLFAGHGDAVADAGFSRSTDLGETWERIGPTGLRVFDIAVHPESGTLIAGIVSAGYGCEIYRSADAAASWQRTFNFGSSASVCGITFDETGVVYVASTGGRLIQSQDDGRSWTESLIPTKYKNIEVFASAGEGLLLAGKGWDAAYTSTDGGASWNDISTGLPKEEFLSAIVQDGGRWMIGTEHGLYAMRIGEHVWTPVSLSSNSKVTAIASNPGGALWIISGYHLYRSTDDAASFTRVDKVPSDIAMTYTMDDKHISGTMTITNEHGALIGSWILKGHRKVF